MNRFIVATVAALAVAGGMYALQGPRAGTGLAELGAAHAQEGEEVDRSLVAEYALGAEDAPLTVIEYASYTCPHCKTFHEGTIKEFKKNYVETGKVRYIYREVYFDRFGLWAGMVARCQPGAAGGAETTEATESTATATEMASEASGEAAAMASESGAEMAGPDAATQRYFALQDLIFAQQAEWLDADTPADIAGNLITIGKTAGLNGDDLNTCMQNNDLARAMIAVYQENAERDGVRSTPSYLIGDELSSGAVSYEKFTAMIDAKLGSE